MGEGGCCGGVVEVGVWLTVGERIDGAGRDVDGDGKVVDEFVWSLLVLQVVGVAA